MTIDLQAFCSKTGPMSKPVAYSGWRYALDGSIVVRVPCGDTDAIPDGFPVDGMAGLPWAGCAKADATLPETNAQPGKRFCPTCYGTGRADDECDNCDGVGQLGNDDAYAASCPKCHGTGKSGQGETCPRCDGAKEIDDYPLVEIPGVKAQYGLRLDYYRLMAGLPGLRYGVSGPTRLAFRFDGGKGFVMLMDRGQA